MEKSFLRVHTKSDGLIPHFVNPQSAVPINRGDSFIAKKKFDHQKENMKLVYSTSTAPASQTPLTVKVESRRGKTVTTVSGFIIPEKVILSLAGKLKAKCGVGGSVKEREILLQGDLKERTKNFLIDEGFKVK